jgi:sugar/nucleoside kinase (ribokinase family)
VGLGEIPCDILPEGRQLGGPRANFAYFSGLLGDRGIITSRVGTDILGEVARDRIEVLGLRPPPCKVMPLT